MLKKGTQKAKDAVLVAHFTEWYCAAHHADRSRVALVSDGVQAGIYRRKAPLLCEECAQFVRYVELRTEKCPKDPKPFCAVCEIKCYRPRMALYSRDVMRYSGPRALFSRYWLAAIRHAISMMKARK